MGWLRHSLVLVTQLSQGSCDNVAGKNSLLTVQLTNASARFNSLIPDDPGDHQLEVELLTVLYFWYLRHPTKAGKRTLVPSGGFLSIYPAAFGVGSKARSCTDLGLHKTFPQSFPLSLSIVWRCSGCREMYLALRQHLLALHFVCKKSGRTVGCFLGSG